MQVGYHQFYFATPGKAISAEGRWAVHGRYWLGGWEQASSQPDPPFTPALPAVPREPRPGELTPLSHGLCPGLFAYFGS